MFMYSDPGPPNNPIRVIPRCLEGQIFVEYILAEKAQSSPSRRPLKPQLPCLWTIKLNRPLVYHSIELLAFPRSHARSPKRYYLDSCLQRYFYLHPQTYSNFLRSLVFLVENDCFGLETHAFLRMKSHHLDLPEAHFDGFSGPNPASD